MLNLLKADLFRVIRTKIVYVSLILAVVLPFFVAALLWLTETAAASLEPSMEMEPLGDTLIANIFSPTLGFSYIFAIFPVVVILMDFGNGTIRNKVIHGYTRHQIFAAHFIVSLIYASVLTSLVAITYTLCGFLMLGVQPIGLEMIPTYLLYYFLGFLGTLMIAAIGCGLALALSNAGAIVITVLGILALNYLGTIFELILTWAQVSDVEYYLSFFPSYYTSILSNCMTYRFEDGIRPFLIIETVLGIFLISGGFYALGTFTFSKKDFK